MKSRLTYGIYLLLGWLVFLSIAGCSNEKRAAEGKPLRNRSANAVLARYYRNMFEFEHVAMRVSAEIETPNDKQSFKANIRLRKDSLIWVSISPLMGVEMVRAIITPDSVKYVSKVPNNKHYFTGTLDQLTEVTKSDVTFDMIQSILVGNAIDLDEERDKFNSKIDQQEYVLISKYKRRMKKVLGGVNDREVDPDDSLSVDANDRQYRRILRRSDEDDLLLKRYWIDGTEYRLRKTVFDDLYYQRSVAIEHSEFEEISGQFYPKKTVVKIKSEEGNAQFAFEITRLKLDKTNDFPFEIPDDYERRIHN